MLRCEVKKEKNMAKTITRLPEPPTTAEPQNFDDRADVFVAAFNPFRDEANALAEEAEANAVRSEDANTAAQSAKESAQTSAQTASEAKEAAARSASDAASSAQTASEAKTAAATSAQEAKERAQAVAETKEELSGSLGALEEMKKIVTTGFIDDTKKRANLTYSSKKIEADFAPKDESSGEQKIYGKALSAVGEANSIVVRDSGGYVSSSTPKSEEFTPDHLVCVRGSDGKEKFVPLETIYKNVLERILKENLPLRSYTDMDIFEKITYKTDYGDKYQAKRLKNKNILTYSVNDGYYTVLTPSLEKAELATPDGASGLARLVRLIDENNTIYCLAANRKLYKLIETNENCSWEEVALPQNIELNSYPSPLPLQILNKFLYLQDKYKRLYKYDGRNWTSTGVTIADSYGIMLEGQVHYYNPPAPFGGWFINDGYFYGGSTAAARIDLKTLAQTSHTTLPQIHNGIIGLNDYENFALVYYRVSPGARRIALKNIKNNVSTQVIRTEFIGQYGWQTSEEFPIRQKGIFAADGEIYFFGTIRDYTSNTEKEVIAKINKKMLAYYGIEI